MKKEIKKPIVDNGNLISTEKEKVLSLFQFIKGMHEIKRNTVTELSSSSYSWFEFISKLPKDPENITIGYRDKVADDEVDLSDDDGVLLAVHKPEFEKCPEPDKIFADFLGAGWNDPNVLIMPENYEENSAQFKNSNESNSLFSPYDEDEDYYGEEVYLSEDPVRVDAYNQWVEKRDKWAEKYKIRKETQNLFGRLYGIYNELERDSETKELVVANGILRDKNNSKINHPVLTKRVKVNYDSDSDTITIEETEAPPELYSMLFHQMEDINLDNIQKMRADLEANDYHPLDRNETPGFLGRVVHLLSDKSLFSEDGIPGQWDVEHRLLLYTNPVYILRNRSDGVPDAIEKIIDDIKNSGDIPAPLKDIVGGEEKNEVPTNDSTRTWEEKLAAVGGESIDVFLTKEANSEQLEIAKRIEKYDAVLVQGPPGTGKTHTIANLMGHFLAQGKSVLVTSHTPKALRVLKEKMVPGLQNLCVSVLEDSNADMVTSVNGITDYTSRTNKHDIENEIERLARERRQVIEGLANIRKKIFQKIYSEYQSVVYMGESMSPAQAAAFVKMNDHVLSGVIPGVVRYPEPLPLTFAELSKLYSSNDILTAEDEIELEKNIPNPESILSPASYDFELKGIQNIGKQLKLCMGSFSWTISYNTDARTITCKKNNQSFQIPFPEEESINALKGRIESLRTLQPWMIACAIDGKRGGAAQERWNLLVSHIQKTEKDAQSLMDYQNRYSMFGDVVEFAALNNYDSYLESLKKLETIFQKNGKITKFLLLFNSDCKVALEKITVNGHSIQSEKECGLAICELILAKQREICGKLWNTLLASQGMPAFSALSGQAPERIAENYISDISVYLNWYKTEYEPIVDLLHGIGISEEIIFGYSALDSDDLRMQKAFAVLSKDLPAFCNICLCILAFVKHEEVLKQNKRILENGNCAESRVCREIVKAMEAGNVSTYEDAYHALDCLYHKYDIQQERSEKLQKIERVAPEWAGAIRNRVGIHGDSRIPPSIADAWKWKQLDVFIKELLASSLEDLQSKSSELSGKYRQITAQYAEKSAWYHLLEKTEGNIGMRQALQGWKQTIQKIGKGTGKSAPKLKAKARELMKTCQLAVPAWIMPINRALATLDPKTNKFDVIIIDEASQSDLSSMAILYMGKKFIIVGDDKQVSPMAIGTQSEAINKLQRDYIQDKIPISHLYDGKYSIYDAAQTTFSPLMLHEHFRCVPEIIGFSNWLSYNGAIKPLRDAGSSNLHPAVVNHRVENGERDEGKKNINEAKEIVALLQACIAQPEYRGKTFGVISLLGDEQVKVIQNLIENNIERKEITERQILCGNAASFQGDERDVIFLSVVDSGREKGPLKMNSGEGAGDTKKRYNVAASRAKDQLWVVHSLDSANDLQSDDIRKKLIDYATNPAAYQKTQNIIAKKSESPFEEKVARALVNIGYHVVQQWEAGAYRIDMVVICGKKKIAIECDGERWHSSEEAVYHDMERQTILERLGWSFIRIRGSEYFRDPEGTMERVVSLLDSYAVYPESSVVVSEDKNRRTDLLERVEVQAALILEEMKKAQKDQNIDSSLIAEAKILKPKTFMRRRGKI